MAAVVKADGVALPPKCDTECVHGRPIVKRCWRCAIESGQDFDAATTSTSGGGAA